MGRNKRGSALAEIGATMFGGSTNQNPAIARETAIQRLYQRIITEIACNRFKWDNVPDEIDVRFLEMTLFYNGLAIWYWDRDYEKMFCVRGNPAGYVNIFDNPVSFQMTGAGSNMMPSPDGSGVVRHLNKTLSAYQPQVTYQDDTARDKAIPMWNNYLRTGDMDIALLYSTRLATVERTLEINTKNARKTKILRATQDTQLSAVNMVRAVDQGDEVVQVTGTFADDIPIDVLDLGVNPDSYDKLSIYRSRVWNECMGLLGIDNANQDKKERLVAAEVSANDGQTDSLRYVSLNARRYAAGMINDVFGTSIKVEFNVEVEAQEKQARAMLGIQNNENGNDDNKDDE